MEGGNGMIEAIYTWMKNIVFYLVIVTAVLEVLPGTTYQKYIRFFTGLVLMLLLLTPFLSLTGTGEAFAELYHGYEYEQYQIELREQEEYFQDLDLLDFLPEEYVVTERGEVTADVQGGGQAAESTVQENGDPDAQYTSSGIAVNEIEVEEIRIGEEVE